MKNTYIIQRILYTLFIFALVVTLCFFYSADRRGRPVCKILSGAGQYER